MNWQRFFYIYAQFQISTHPHYDFHSLNARKKRATGHTDISTRARADKSHFARARTFVFRSGKVIRLENVTTHVASKRNGGENLLQTELKSAAPRGKNVKCAGAKENRGRNSERETRGTRARDKREDKHCYTLGQFGGGVRGIPRDSLVI